MTDTKERRNAIDFTDEYYRSELVLITKKSVAETYDNQVLGDETLGSLLNGKGLISQISTVTDDVLETFKQKYSVIHQTPVDTFAVASTKVSSGAAFAMTSELPVAQSICKANNDLGIIHINQDVLGLDLAELGVSIGIKKGDNDLKEKLNKVLSNYKKEDRDSDMQEAVERSGN
jgi:ABC-type amino acid transport substrate-binding protein